MIVKNNSTEETNLKNIGWVYKFSFWAPKERIPPVPDMELCYVDANNPDRMNIWVNDPTCGSKFGWTYKFKINVYSSPNPLTSKYTIYTAGSPDRSFIKPSDQNPGTGWTKSTDFYAFGTFVPNTIRNCVMTPIDTSTTVRQVIFQSDDCTDKFGWKNDFIFYSPIKK
jgi:hypothetical protein